MAEKYSSHYDRMGNQSPELLTDFGIAQADYGKKGWFQKLPTNSKVLDIGCGYGYTLYSMQLLGFNQLTGIDMDESCVAIAQKALPSAQIKHTDALTYLETTQDRFDIVFLFDVLEHIDKSQSVRTLQGISKVLNKGGKLVARVPNSSSLLSSYSMGMDFTHVTLLNEFSVMQLMEWSGFNQPVFESDFFHIPWKTKMYKKIILRSALKILTVCNLAIHIFAYVLRGQRPYPTRIGYNIEFCSTKM
jgi:2-polyprenyl-3-methyl-5-hydroxy-6-metoxy-1,4-benzoquinol methylase